MPIFEGTISAGNVITIISFAIIWGITLAMSWTKLGGRIDLIEMRLDNSNATMKAVSDILIKFQTNETEIALMKQEIVSLQINHSTLHKTVEELRRGEGFIQGRRSGIDGEHNR